MRFSIQEEGKEKQIFHRFSDANLVTGIASRTFIKFSKGKHKIQILQENQMEKFFLFGWSLMNVVLLSKLMGKILMVMRKLKKNLIFPNSLSIRF